LVRFDACIVQQDDGKQSAKKLDSHGRGVEQSEKNGKVDRTVREGRDLEIEAFEEGVDTAREVCTFVFVPPLIITFTRKPRTV